MNFMSQQPGFGQSNFQQTGYKPTGFVQSQYKGQLRKSYRPQQQPVTSQTGGYQANQSFGWQSNFAGSSFGQSQQFGASSFSQPIQTQSASNAGPVNSKFGYSPGYNAIGSSQIGMQAQSGMQAQTGFQSGMPAGMSSQSSESWHHPVNEATNFRAQSGPVISKLGWQSSR